MSRVEVRPLTEQQIDNLFALASEHHLNDLVPSDILGILMDADEFEYCVCQEDIADQELLKSFQMRRSEVSELPRGFSLENKRWLMQLANLVGYNFIIDTLRAMQNGYAIERRKYKLI